MKKSESIGRLLLTLLTAFVMVAGVFGAANLTDNSKTSVTPDQEILEKTAAGVQDVTGKGETGDAPVSASDIHSTETSEETELLGINSGPSISPLSNELEGNLGEVANIPPSEDGIPAIDSIFRPAEVEQELPVEHDGYEPEEQEFKKETEENMDEEQGTRSPGPVLDAGGPYGTVDNPWYEGDSHQVTSTVYDGPNDLSANYMYRWDFLNNGEWTDWSAYGANSIYYAFPDDNLNVLKAQAWDETQRWDQVHNAMWNDVVLQNTIGGIYYYTWGNRFRVNYDITVDKLGGGNTRYWNSPNPYMPGYYEDVRLWTATGGLLASTGMFDPADGEWGWVDVTDVPLTAGTTYVISMHAMYDVYQYPDYYCHLGGASADMNLADDNAITFLTSCYYSGHNVFPRNSYSSAYAFFCDIDYYVMGWVDNILEDEADTFIWNREPQILDASASGPILEGNEAEFNGLFRDKGINDDWEFMWDWGDGSSSPWMEVPKWGGGADVLFLAALYTYNAPTAQALEDALGNRAKTFDVHNLGRIGGGSNPTLEQLMKYDVVVVAAWDYIDERDELGDMLADYVDAGGGVVQCGGTFWPSPPGEMGITGRWLDEEYNAIEYTVPLVATRSLGTYDASHPIMDGITNVISYVNHPDSFATTTYSYWVASMNTGAMFVAATDAGHHGIAGSGRIVGYNTYAQVAPYTGGQHFALLANAAMWASQQPAPYPLPMPMQLPTVTHVYKDDHPTHITPSDDVQATLYIRDDDHCRDVLLETNELLDEDFGPLSPATWGTYGNNPPAGWTIEDFGDEPGIPPLKYVGDKFWGTDLDDNYNPSGDQYLRTVVDLSGSSVYAELTFDMWYRIYSASYRARGYCEIAHDAAGPWTQLGAWSSTSAGDDWLEYNYDISSFIGDSTVYIQWRLWSSSYYYTYEGMYIDNVNVKMYDSKTLITDYLESFESDDGGYNDYGSGEEWEWGDPSYGPSSGYDGSNCWGTDLDSTYENYADWRLETPTITLPSETAELTFWHWVYIESYYDGGNVKISTDNGATWNVLGSYPDPYNEDAVYSGNSGIPGEPAFNAYYNYWRQATFDLAGYEGETIMLRFHFGSDASVYYYGWYIDLVDIHHVQYTNLVTVLDEDFDTTDGGFTHSGPEDEWEWGTTKGPWNYNDWHRYTSSSTSYRPVNGAGAYARCYYYPYDGPDYARAHLDDRLITDPLPLSGEMQLFIDFDHLIATTSSYSDTVRDVDVSWDGGPWTTVYSNDDPYTYPYPTEHRQVITPIPPGASNVQVRWRITGHGYWWSVDNVHIEAVNVRHVYGLAQMTIGVTVNNVMPGLYVPEDFVDVADESFTAEFHGFQVSDPAGYEDTEEFFYRIDMDDGMGPGPWQHATAAPVAGNVLLMHWVELTGNSGPDINDLIDAIQASSVVNNLDIWHIGPSGYGNGAPSLDVVNQYDAAIFCDNWGQYSAEWDGIREDVGDRLADFMDGGGGVFTFMMAHDGSAGQPWNLLGRYIDEDYGPFELTPYNIASINLGTIYNPTHPVMQGVTSLRGSVVYGGDYPLTAGAELLADWTNGNSAIGVKDHGFARCVHMGGGIYAGYDIGDFDTFVDNALTWVMRSPPEIQISDFEQLYMDNGIYNIDFQILDDDMNWDFSGGYPDYVGPQGEMDQWITHNIVPVEIFNVDPTTRPIRAEISLDLAIRTTGEPGNPATMTLFYDGTAVGSVTSVHQGNQQIAVMPSTLDVGDINNYHIEVDYVGSGGGTNPTWIFQGRFSSGHIKELKHEFQDGDPAWVIGPEYLRAMLVGEDITFVTVASDIGSDDLMFLWNFGDGGIGANLYANTAPMVPVEGTLGPAPEMFNALGGSGDPWFDRPANDVRSPWGGPITVSEAETHAFSGPGYYHVMLAVHDDDTGDGYYSFQNFNNDGGYDMEFIEIDLR